MGWGLQKAEREAVLKDCLITASKKPAEAAQVAVADMNAKIRQKAVDVTGAAKRLSMHRVVRNVVREVAKDATEHMILVFDAPCVMPAIRSVLWKSRYGGKGSEATPAEILRGIEFCKKAESSTTAARAPPPVSYQVMFTPGKAKTATWAAMTQIARREAAAVAAELGIRATVIDSQNEVFDTNGADADLAGWTAATRGYGEADLKVYALGQAAAAGAEPKAVVLHSVDTDLILQAVATCAVGGGAAGPDASAWIPKKTFTIKLKTCTVDCRALLQTFGARNVAKRLNAAFWFVMAGGTDYSRPASDQGFAKRALLDAAHPLRLTPSPFTDVGPSDVRKVLGQLKGTRKVTRTVCGKAKRSNRSLKRCLEQAASVVLYYGLINTNPDDSLFK